MTEQAKEKGLVWLLVGWLVLVLYVGLMISLDQLPLSDMANHATRAYIIAQQLQGSAYTDLFQYSFRLQPYIFGDLILASFFFIFPFRIGAVLYLVVLFLLWIGSVLLYARMRGISRSGLLWLFLLSPWLATNYFFLSGFANWTLGAALAFVALAFLETFCRAEGWAKSGVRIVVFSSMLIFCYLVHLAPLVILGPVIFGTVFGWWLEGRERWWKGLFALLVVGLIVVSHLAMGHLGGAEGEHWGYLSWSRKLLRLSSMFARYNFAIDGIFCVLLGGAVVALLWAVRPTWQRAIGCLSSSIAAAALYFVLPAELGPATDVDTRATMFMVVLGVVGLVKLIEQEGVGFCRSFWIAALISAGNLFYLGYYLVPANEHLSHLVALLEGVPKGESVFTVSTRAQQGHLHFSLHPPETAIVERGVMVPYLFTANLAGEQLRYFVCQRHLYLPSNLWYINEVESDWVKVRRSYTYMLVEKPFELSRLDPNLLLVRENQSGALFAFR